MVRPSLEIDHFFHIEDSSNVRITDCSFWAQKDGIRTVNSSNITVHGCLVQGMDYDSSDRGILVLGSGTNSLTICNNTISNFGMGICYIDYADSSTVKIEGNRIVNSGIAGVYAQQITAAVIDLGGGSLGSAGGNVFSSTNALVPDILLTNSFVDAVYALGNTWSSADVESILYDREDDPSLPRVIHSQPNVNIVSASNGRASISWTSYNDSPTNVICETYAVEACTNLIEGAWFAITNGIQGNSLTNTPLGRRMFYRVVAAKTVTSHFEFVAGSFTWHEAKAHAEVRGGHLATITSEAENDIAKDVIIDAGASSAWIGATDEDVDGEWRWAVGPESGSQFWEGNAWGTMLGYHKWRFPEPTDADGWAYGYMCVTGTFVGGEWGAVYSDSRRGYLLETEP